MPPLATYRLQVHAGFAFDAVAGVADYLAALGVSHAYLSPVLQAAPGSEHGYDVVDHGRLSDDLGGAAGWARLREAVRREGLRVVVDVVPNHMAVPRPESLNRPLWDVLRHGRGSAYAGWFDVDWDAQDGRLLMPVLGAPLGEVLDKGELRVDGDLLRYHDHEFPLAPGTEATPLPDLLDAQHYRLAHWRLGNEEVNYRRFFDVTSLIAVRVDRPDVFDVTHEVLTGLVRTGEVDGLRVDHPDGLADPGGYLARLAEATGDCWVVVEKVTETDEWLPPRWRCAGTTGYDALNRLNRLLTDPAGERPLTDCYAALAGATADVHAVVADGKRLAVRDVLAAEVERLTDLLVVVARADAHTRDVARRWLREALVEVLVGLDVYRAYVTPGEPPDDEAARQVRRACAAARARRPDRAAEVDWVGTLALGAGESPAAREFCVRFQQTTGPVTAKGVEDTATYRYLRLVSLNEVGGDPARFGEDPTRFHDYCARVATDWPETLTTVSTHDTKRSEDVRARLAVLAEVPAEWARRLPQWRARHHFATDPNLEYLFWQTLVGAWPLPRHRMQAYLHKAAREAKQHTSWLDPDPRYEQALHGFVDAVYDDHDLAADVADFVRGSLLEAGRSNSLAQKLLQLTMPGVADVYQGSELWDLSLVDPDNRRPVDYDLRRWMLTELDAGTSPPPLAHDDAGAAKLLVVSRALRLRREHPERLGPGAGYHPLPAAGPAADHAVAFVRGDAVVTVATRLPVGLRRHGGWRDTTVTLPAGGWLDVLTDRLHPGGVVRVGELLGTLPVALLTAASTAGPAGR